MVLRLVSFLFLFVLFTGYSQKDTREILDSNGIKIIELELDEVYQLRMVASKVDNIQLETHSEGEYHNDITIDASRDGGVLKINSNYRENLSGGYDKLSAHKVFSIDLEIIIPENMEVYVYSKNTSVVAKGSYKSFSANLKQGFCKLVDFEGNATVNTYDGNILVETSMGKVEAKSRNGKVTLPGYITGRNLLRLTSIDGDIVVRKK